jgi:hypothetical protein
VVCFVISRVEPSGTVSKDSVRSWGDGLCGTEVDGTGPKCAQWWALVLEILNVWVLFLRFCYINSSS